MRDPIQRIRRRVFVTWLVAMPAIFIIAAWAIGPIDPPRVEVQAVDHSTPPHARQLASDDIIKPLNLAGFSVRLWHEPQDTQQHPTTITQQKTPSTPFPDAQLIAIIQENPSEPRRAAIYIPALDELVIAGKSDSIGTDLRILTISEASVELDHKGHIRQLVLILPEPLTLGDIR